MPASPSYELAALSKQSRVGSLYRVDLRLRPMDGRFAGQPVAAFISFCNKRADLWNGWRTLKPPGPWLETWNLAATIEVAAREIDHQNGAP